jgi:hypothetical protein
MPSLPSSLTINFCTVVATAVAALTTTINFCTVVVTDVPGMTTTINKLHSRSN